MFQINFRSMAFKIIDNLWLSPYCFLNIWYYIPYTSMYSFHLPVVCIHAIYNYSFNSKFPSPHWLNFNNDTWGKEGSGISFTTPQFVMLACFFLPFTRRSYFIAIAWIETRTLLSLFLLSSPSSSSHSCIFRRSWMNVFEIKDQSSCLKHGLQQRLSVRFVGANKKKRSM